MSITKDIMDFMIGWAEWKAVKAEAAKIPQIERRLAALEARLQTGGGPTCAACGSSSLTRTGTRKSPGPFGALGAQEARFTCAICGAETFIEQPLS